MPDSCKFSRFRKNSLKNLRSCLLAGAIFALAACAAPAPVESSEQPAEGGVAASETIAAKPAYNETALKSGDLSGLHIDAGKGTPVVLIVPGSGPTDLNGNNPMGVSAGTYKLLAEALADKDISTVRVDKRGMFSSAGAGDPNAVTIDMYAQDYRNWAETIRGETGQPCVHMLGHSEGALMVSAASIDNDNVCSLILVAGAGRPMGDVLRAQLEANPANKPILKQAFGAIETLEQGEPVDTSKLHPALKALFAAEVQDYWMSIIDVDPAKVAAQANQNTLVIHGVNDLQTSTEDAQKLADATGGHLVMIDGINHVLKEAPLNRQRNFATYSKPDLPVSESVVEAIRIFVTE